MANNSILDSEISWNEPTQPSSPQFSSPADEQVIWEGEEASWPETLGRTAQNVGYGLGADVGGLLQYIGEDAEREQDTLVRSVDELLQTPEPRERRRPGPGGTLGINLQDRPLTPDAMDKPIREGLDAVSDYMAGGKIAAAIAQGKLSDEAEEAYKEGELNRLKKLIQTGEGFSPSWFQEKVGGKVQELGKQTFDFWSEKAEENQPDVVKRSPKWYVSKGGEFSGRTLLPAVVATLITKRPSAGLAIMAPQVKGQSYARSKEEGLSPVEADWKSTYDMITEVGTEAVPLGVLTKTGGRLIMRPVKAMPAEGVQEAVNEAMQMGYEAGVLDEDMPADQAMQKLLDAGIFGLVGGGMASVPAMASDVAGRKSVSRQAESLKKNKVAESGQVDQVLRDLKAGKLDNQQAQERLGDLFQSGMQGKVRQAAESLHQAGIFSQEQRDEILTGMNEGTLDLDMAQRKVREGYQEAEAKKQESEQAQFAREALDNPQVFEDLRQRLSEQRGQEIHPDDLEAMLIQQAAMPETAPKPETPQPGMQDLEGGFMDRSGEATRQSPFLQPPKRTFPRKPGLETKARQEQAMQEPKQKRLQLDMLKALDRLEKRREPTRLSPEEWRGELERRVEGRRAADAVLKDVLPRVSARRTEQEQAYRQAKEEERRQEEAIKRPPTRVRDKRAVPREEIEASPTPIPDEQIEWGEESGAAPGQEVNFKPDGTPYTEKGAKLIARNKQKKGVPAEPVEVEPGKWGWRKKPVESRVEEAAQETDTDPTEAQKKAGNYQKGRVSIQGLDVSIENPAGSTRSGTAPDGTEWSTTMQHHYGYVRGSRGKDGDQVDVFVGADPESETVFVVDQVDPETGKFDEHKAVLGAQTESEARDVYLSNYEDGWQGLGDITEMPVDEFKDWLNKGKRTRPVGQVNVQKRGEESQTNHVYQVHNEAREAHKKELSKRFTKERRLVKEKGGITYTLTKDSSQGFRITSFDKNMEPLGHESYKDRESAIREFAQLTPEEEIRPDFPEAMLLLHDKYNYIYESTQRPVGPGSVPKDGLVETRDNDGYGIVVYNRPLSEKTLDQYDLKPVGYEERKAGEAGENAREIRDDEGQVLPREAEGVEEAESVLPTDQIDQGEALQQRPEQGREDLQQPEPEQAGDGEGLTPEVLTFDEFSNRRGVSNTPPSFPEAHTRGRRSKATQRATSKRISSALDEWQKQRDNLYQEYQQKVEAGEIRPPTSEERLRKTAEGEGKQAEAAKRALEKREERKAQREQQEDPLDLYSFLEESQTEEARKEREAEREQFRREKNQALQAIDSRVQELGEEIQDWKSRKYKSSGKTVSYADPQDNLTERKISVDKANENRRQREIKRREEEISDLETLKTNIQNIHETQELRKFIDQVNLPDLRARMKESRDAQRERTEDRGRQDLPEVEGIAEEKQESINAIIDAAEDPAKDIFDTQEVLQRELEAGGFTEDEARAVNNALDNQLDTVEETGAIDRDQFYRDFEANLPEEISEQELGTTRERRGQETIVQEQEHELYEKGVGRIREMGGLQRADVLEQHGQAGVEEMQARFGRAFVRKDGFPMDVIAQNLAEEHPELGIESGDKESLWRYLSDHAKSRAEIGGKSAPKKGKKKAKTKEPKPAEVTEEPQPSKEKPTKKPQPQQVEDFGEKLGGARKDQLPSIHKEWTQDEIAAQPLSKIWPKSEVDAIEDPFLAAVAHSFRNEIPAKPKQGYRRQIWAEKVQTIRGVMASVENLGRERLFEKLDEYPSLKHLGDKIRLLEQLDRKQWGRIGRVESFPNAEVYINGRPQPSPHVRVKIDDRHVVIRDVTDPVQGLDTVREKLEGQETGKGPQFEVRHNVKQGHYFINRKGDPEYTPLKVFKSLQEARTYLNENHDALVAAWEENKELSNIKKEDVRSRENRPRTGQDHRKGKDVSSEEFTETFGFRGVEFGNWVKQGKNAAERQEMLNQAYDALMDLSNILNLPPRAISLNGDLGLGLGSRGRGWAAAHYEPGRLVINLTKTRGAGTLAHEWFHALDNYFQRKRGTGPTRESYYVTYQPETVYRSRDDSRRSLSETRYNELDKRGRINPERWERIEGIRPEVEAVWADLVKAIDESPMTERARLADKGRAGGYWSRIIERAARSFENYVIARMMQEGYQDDYLANVIQINKFARDHSRYPYLLENEVQPISEAFDNLFAALKTQETDQGVALYSFAGRTAETADTHSLYRAMRMIAQGEDTETVRQETGWFKGPDDKWRFEISDEDAQINSDALQEEMGRGYKGIYAARLGDLLKHEKLYAAYPWLRDVDIATSHVKSSTAYYGLNLITLSQVVHQEIADFKKGTHRKFLERQLKRLQKQDVVAEGRASWQEFPDQYESLEQAIEDQRRFRDEEIEKLKQALKQEDPGGIRRAAEKRLASHLFHEIQHFIQSKEGFARGGAPGEFRSGPRAEAPEASYRALAGEVEARNVQARRSLSEAGISVTPPELTADVSPENLIVVFDGQVAKNAPIPANARAQVPEGVAASALKKSVDATKKRWANAPPVNVLQSEAELPDAIQQDIASKDAQGEIEGVLWQGQVYLVADNISSIERGQFVLLHESWGHTGLRGVMGQDAKPILKQAYVHKDVRDRAQALAGDYGFDLQTESGRIRATEEALANMAAEGVESTALDRVVAKVREWIRKVFPKLKMSNAEIRTLIGKGRAFVEKGLTARRPTATIGSMATSQGPGTYSANQPLQPENGEQWAFRQYVNETLPEGWYVHGRAERQDLETGYVIQVTQDWETADGYAGKDGSVWILRPSEDANVLDFSSPNTADIERVVDRFMQDFEEGQLPPQLEDIASQVTSKQDLMDDLSPERIAEAAGVFDEPRFNEWLYDSFEVDFVKTPDGGVFLDTRNQVALKASDKPLDFDEKTEAAERLSSEPTRPPSEGGIAYSRRKPDITPEELMQAFRDIKAQDQYGTQGKQQAEEVSGVKYPSDQEIQDAAKWAGATGGDIFNAVSTGGVKAIPKKFRYIPHSDFSRIAAIGVPYFQARLEHTKALKQQKKLAQGENVPEPDEGFGRIFQAFETRQEKRNALFTDLAEPAEEFWSAKGEELNELRDLIWLLDKTGQTNKQLKSIRKFQPVKDENGRKVRVNGKVVIQIHPEFYDNLDTWMKNQGVSEGVRRQYLSVRRSLDNSLLTYYNWMLERGEWASSSDLQEYRRRINTDLKFYFPHKRRGKWFVQARDKEGNVIYRQHFDLKVPGEKTTQQRMVERKAKRIADQLEQQYPGATWTSGKVSKHPEEVFEDPIPLTAMQQILDSAANKIDANKQDQSKLQDALTEATSDILKGRGWSAHAIRRKDPPVEGFEMDDVQGVLLEYISGLSGSLTKMDASHEATKALQEIVAEKQPTKYAYATQYTRAQLRNQDAIDRWAGNVKSWAFVRYLGLNFHTATLNLTQNVIAGVPRLSMDVGANAFRFYKDALEYVAKGGRKAVVGGRFSDEDTRMLNELYHEGISSDNYTQEVAGRVQRVGPKTFWTKFVNVNAWPMKVAETFNRSSLALASFRAARQGKVVNKQTLEEFGYSQGEAWSYEDAKAFAERVTKDSHFVYGKTNRPNFFTSTAIGRAVSPAYTFRTFTHNYLSLLRLMLHHGGRGAAAFGQSMLMTVVMGGLTSLPLYNTLTSLYQSLFDDDEDLARNAWRKAVPELAGDYPDLLRDIVTYGTPSLFGVNIGGSIRIETPGSFGAWKSRTMKETSLNALKDLLGIPWDMTVELPSKTWEAWQLGEKRRALEHLPIIPAVVSKSMEAMREYSEGKITVSGRPINTIGKNQPKKPSALDSILSGIGYNTLSSSKAWDQSRLMSLSRSVKMEKQGKLATKMARAARSGEEEQFKNLVREWRDWNQDALKSKEIWKVITPKQLKQSLMARGDARQPPKYMLQRFMELKEIYNE